MSWRRLVAVGAVLAAGGSFAVAGGTWRPPAAAAADRGAYLAPVWGRAASGGAVIVVLKDQHTRLSLRTQAAQRTAAAYARQRAIVASIRAGGGTGVTQLVAPSAVAAHVPAAEVSRLRRDPAVAEIVPDAPIPMSSPDAAPAPRTGTRPPARHSAAVRAKTKTCPFNPAGPAHPLQEPEAVADIHASDGDPSAPGMANSIATGKGVIIANYGMNELAGNPNFTRPDGSHVVIDAPSYTANDGSLESYGDASSMAAQGTVTYQYARALPYSSVPAGCRFDIKGDAPGASLVDLTKIDTPIPVLSTVIAGIDNVVAKVHADVISESFGVHPVLPRPYRALIVAADEAAVEAGVTVVESAGDCGASGTVIAASDDPMVIAAGAVDNFRLVAMNDGYHRYVSNQMAALSSGGTAPTGKVVNLVAPGWYGGEAACADNSNGCPPGYPAESFRGTSEAAPLIAGAAADVIQAYRDTHHGASPTPQVVQDILTSTATDLGNPADQQGSGLLNVYAAVKAAQQLPGTTAAGSAGSASLVVAPSQLDVAGDGGTASDQSVSLYNTSRSATTVTGTYRWAGPARRLSPVVTEQVSTPPKSQPIPPEGATAARTITFTVPPGLGLLDADMIWPDPANGSVLQFQLFNPQGALVQESYDDPDGDHFYGVPIDDAPNIQHATVATPEPGRWTARILWSGLDVDLAYGPEAPGSYRGTVQFEVSGQHYLTSPASPPTTIPGHTSVSIPLTVTLPTPPGDHPESVQFTAGNGARTSLPVARRTFIPAGGGAFRVRITSSVGRDVGQISTDEINLPTGRKYLDIRLHTADASPDNKFTFYLVNPSGRTVATATTPGTAGGKPTAAAQLYTLHPVPGLWQIDVLLDLTVSGKEFTQTVYGSLTDP